jgi:hypothetical protein
VEPVLTKEIEGLLLYVGFVNYLVKRNHSIEELESTFGRYSNFLKQVKDLNYDIVELNNSEELAVSNIHKERIAYFKMKGAVNKRCRKLMKQEPYLLRGLEYLLWRSHIDGHYKEEIKELKIMHEDISVFMAIAYDKKDFSIPDKFIGSARTYRNID